MTSPAFRRLASIATILGIFLVPTFGLHSTRIRGNDDPDNLKIERFATDKHFAAIYLRPQKLKQGVLADAHPFRSALPSSMSFRRISRLPIDELLILLNKGSRPNRFSSKFDEIEFTCVARLNQNKSSGLIVENWNQSVLDVDKKSNRFSRIRINGHECLELPAGTFFQSKHRHGELSFVNREGEPVSRGINVGSLYDYRSFSAGNSKAHAVFTLRRLTQSDLDQGRLNLVINPSVVNTGRLTEEYASMQLSVIDPKSNSRSAPIKFKVESFQDSFLTLPANLEMTGTDGTRYTASSSHLAKLGLKILLEGDQVQSYFGFGKESLGVIGPEREYLTTVDQTLYITQSRNAMSRMLEIENAKTTTQNHSEVARQLVDLKGDLRVVAKPDDRDRSLLESLFEKLGFQEIAYTLASSLDHMTVVVFESQNRHNLGIKVSLQNSGRLYRLVSKIRSHSLRDFYQDEISKQLRMLWHRSAFINLIMDGADCSICRFDELPDWQRIHRQLVDKLFSGLTIKTESTTAQFIFSISKLFEKLTPYEKRSLALFNEIMADRYFHREQFDDFAEALRLASIHGLNELTDRIRHAHQYTFNASREFEGYALKYAWIRRGIHTLLEGAERNPDSVDLLVFTAMFMVAKFDRSDEAEHLRRIFSHDTILQSRLKKFVDLSDLKESEHQSVSLRIARKIIDHCIQRVSSSEQTLVELPRLVLYSQPGFIQIEQAKQLDQAGDFQKAQWEWLKANRELQELREWIKRNKHDDYKQRLKKSHKEFYQSRSINEELLDTPEQMIELDYWLARTKIEQLTSIREARALAMKGEKLFRNSLDNHALQNFSQAIQKVEDVSNRYPKEFEWIAGDFKKIADGHRRGLLLANKYQKEKLPRCVKLIDQAPERPYQNIVTGSYSLKLEPTKSQSLNQNR